MKLRLQLLAFVMILSTGILQAQKVQIGMRLESNAFKILRATEVYFSDPRPSELQINASIYPFERLAIEARLGAEGSKEYYEGLEYGLFARYYFIKYVYATAGLIVHNIISDSHNTWGQYASTLVMPGFGIGLNPGEHVFFEFMYLYSGTKEVGYDLSFDVSGQKTPTYIDRIFKFGVGFGINL